MREAIVEKLRGIERDEGIRILHAVESGSRAWGFASPDSDYDVRFIYLRPREHYLRLDRLRDVLELPVDSVWDVNGWDLQKALRLLHAANPTLFEWCQSPIVYQTTPFFAERLLPVIQRYFSSRAGIWHYLSMAEEQYGRYLQGERVRPKKYFYALRPILACEWILERRTPPPMAFAELAAAQLPPELQGPVEELLALKRRGGELAEIPRVDALNAFMLRELERLRARAAALPRDSQRDWGLLNRLFLQALAGE